MVLGYRLIDIRLFWRPNIRIVKIAIRFSTICNVNLLKKLSLDFQGIKIESFLDLLVHLKIIAPKDYSRYVLYTKCFTNV